MFIHLAHFAVLLRWFFFYIFNCFCKSFYFMFTCKGQILMMISYLKFSVAKRKSLFDDKPVEIQELTYIIKQDIGSLNKQIAQLQQVRYCHGYYFWNKTIYNLVSTSGATIRQLLLKLSALWLFIAKSKPTFLLDLESILLNHFFCAVKMVK